MAVAVQFDEVVAVVRGGLMIVHDHHALGNAENGQGECEHIPVSVQCVVRVGNALHPFAVELLVGETIGCDLSSTLPIGRYSAT